MLCSKALSDYSSLHEDMEMIVEKQYILQSIYKILIYAYVFVCIFILFTSVQIYLVD